MLVGDPNQLPPLVSSWAAEEGGLGTSLFKRLCDAHPQASVHTPQACCDVKAQRTAC